MLEGHDKKKNQNYVRGVKKNATLEKSRAGVNNETLRRLRRCKKFFVELDR